MGMMRRIYILENENEIAPGFSKKRKRMVFDGSHRALRSVRSASATVCHGRGGGHWIRNKCSGGSKVVDLAVVLHEPQDFLADTEKFIFTRG